MSVSSGVYELYKPLRNSLRTLDLAESLFVIYAYIQHDQSGSSIPAVIETSPGFERSIHPWQLEVVTRELFANANYKDTSDSLRSWNKLAQVMNKLKNMEEQIYLRYLRNTDMLHQLHVDVHRQFPWQDRPNLAQFLRYMKVFNHPVLDKIMQDTLGISARVYFIIGTALYGHFLNSLYLDVNPKIEIPAFDAAEFKCFINIMKQNVDALKREIEEKRQFNPEFAYQFNPLRKYPLIEKSLGTQQKLLCPISTFLFWRMTAGLYYELCNHSDFGNAFGESFQAYVGEVIDAICSSHKEYKLVSEAEFHYGGQRFDTIDWILDGQDAAIFIECKTKRLTLDARYQIDQTQLEQQLDKMADFVVQAYKSIKHCKGGLYPGYDFSAAKQAYPLVVTLEDWYSFGDYLYELLDKKIREKMGKEGLDISWLETMPYSTCSIKELEQMTQIIMHVGIRTFMDGKLRDADLRKWLWGPYIRARFPEYEPLAFLFEKEMQDLITAAKLTPNTAI